MAERKVYVGNLGPEVYDDAEDLGDSSFMGAKRAAVVTDGLIIAAGLVVGDDIYGRIGVSIVAAGTATTSGGAAAEDIIVANVIAEDVALAVLSEEGATPRVIKTVVAGTSKITITFDDDPSNDHKINYIVLRNS